MERLAARVGMRLATPRELQALRSGLDRLPDLLSVANRATSLLMGSLAASFDPLADLAEMLHQRLAAVPAAVVGQGVIAGGWDPELDEQRQLARGGKELLAGIESVERERTGISSLKIEYNKVFGYYIEISKSNLDRVPEDYERRQTLTNAERYVTSELKDLESKILSAEERSTARERELFDELLGELARDAPRISSTAGTHRDGWTYSPPFRIVHAGGTTAGRSWRRDQVWTSVKDGTRSSKRSSATHRSSPTTVSWIPDRPRSCFSRGRIWAENPPTFAKSL